MNRQQLDTVADALADISRELSAMIATKTGGESPSTLFGWYRTINSAASRIAAATGVQYPPESGDSSD